MTPPCCPHPRSPRLRNRLLPGLLVLLLASAAPAATLHLSGPPGAAVSLDGRDLGLLPLASAVELPAGVYTLRCTLRGYQDLEQTVVLGEPESWLHLRLRPVPLRRLEAVESSLLFAGLGQWYRDDTWRGWLYFLGEAGGLLTAVAGEVQRTTFRDDYLNYRDNYRSAIDGQEIAFWRAEATAAYADMEDMKNLRNTGLIVAGSAWLLSILDAWLLTPTVDLGPGVIPPGAWRDGPDHAAGRGQLAGMVPEPGGAHAAVTLTF